MADLPRIIKLAGDKTTGRKKTYLKVAGAVLWMLVIFSITALAANPFTANSTIVDQDKENQTTLTIYKNQPEDSTPFHAANMFPGDSEQKTYLLAVSYRGTVTVHFHADVRSGSEKLAEVMNCRVVLKNTNETLYDGLMKDMPESLAHKLVSSKATTDELEYEITAYLSTSVGNEYMNKELLADFRWWAVEEKVPGSGGDDGGDDEPIKPTQKPGHDVITDQSSAGDSEEPFLPGQLAVLPMTGDRSLFPIAAIAVVCAAMLFVLLFGKRRKEDAEDEK